MQTQRISVRGVVQGVGFRPFVYQLAQENSLVGWVCNTSGDVTIVVEGKSQDIEKFLTALRENPPPQAHIESISVAAESTNGYKHFEIRESLVKEDEYQLISPDLATCIACQKDIFDPSNHRYHYPFTNCTNCGPRFTIIKDIPYDRPRTTMKDFQMCPECQAEYEDPLNRRFHAQPNACPVCGPQLELTDSSGQKIDTANIINCASRLLGEGNILAIKGLGGFLLACDATSDEAVGKLRQRKKRPAKPLAVMVKDITEAKKYCCLSQAEIELMTSPASPIVLLKMQSFSSISPAVAPGLKYLGLMLPYTPLHHLLMHDSVLPLVMTSGNLSEEPIAKDNFEALRRLQGIADYFILHNRDIHSRYDDSVVLVEQNHPQIARRARGYAPHPIHLPFVAKPVLACGAELKNTFCLTRDNHAFISQHIGDMENLETLEHFESTIQLYEKLFRIQPEIIACDLHPDYLPTKWAETEAKKNGLPVIQVQHHHAHIVSCMVDNGVQKPVIGVAFDGTGYGPDGKVWGGEFMVADYRRFQRKAHFEYLPLPGGNTAISKPYRIALGYIYTLLGADALQADLPCLKDRDEFEIGLIGKQIDRRLNTPLTSSCGRLFDAVSSLVGIRQQVEYEGQAAIELEMIADENLADGFYPFISEMHDGVRIIRVKEMLSAIIYDIRRRIPAAAISVKFHNTIANITLEICRQISSETGIYQVALSGGVFQNRLLLQKMVKGLEEAGLTPLLHRQVPCNDGGISLGQAVITNFNWRDGTE